MKTQKEIDFEDILETKIAVRQQCDCDKGTCWLSNCEKSADEIIIDIAKMAPQTFPFLNKLVNNSVEWIQSRIKNPGKFEELILSGLLHSKKSKEEKRVLLVLWRESGGRSIEPSV